MLTVPVSTTAEHLSHGVEETALAGPGEAPGSPSVSAEEHARGLETDCFSPEGEADVEDIRKSVREKDAFCGQLVYAEDTNFTQESPPDQEILSGQIATFDVVTARENGEYLTECVPFCPDGEGQPAGGDIAWGAVHTAGAAAGLTDDPGTADGGESDDRDQGYGAMVKTGSEGQTLQRTTGAWEMNGWIMPAPQRSFVAHLLGPEGNPISDDQLETMVSDLKDQGVLGGNTAPSICGWTPNADFISTGTQTNCEVEFVYREPSDSDLRYDGYDDRCESPTYVCGQGNGAYWTATSSGIVAYGGQEDDDYFVWHWVVAPHPSPCDGIIEPRVGFGTPADAEIPFLAHDLDVYTPAHKLNNAPHLSTDGVKAYYNAVLGNAFDAVDTPDELDGVVNEVENRANDAIETVNDAATVADKSERVEPNNGDPVGSIDDNSQQIALERDLGGECDVLQSVESPETADPWVSYVDNELVQSFGVLGTTNPSQPYLTADRNQDENNAPGPGTFWTQGYLGVFADKNDDGDYDQVPAGTVFGGQKYQADEIKATGAYPLLWDMWVTEDGQIDETAGCAGVQNKPFAQLMGDAGYGPNTALTQAIYLREPTVFYETGTGQSVSYPGGDNVYVMTSQSARVLWDGDPVADAGNPVDQRVDDLVNELRAYAASTGSSSPSDVGVETPGEEIGLTKDFDDQCSEATGGYQQRMQFTHDCRIDCTGDTIATMYTFQVDSADGQLGGQDTEIPPLTVDGTTFPPDGNGQYTWYDVDPFDGDPDRNSDESSAPPN